MGYVLQRVGDGAFVAPAGRQHSYVVSLQDARRFPTREAAENQKCGNERVVAVESLLQKVLAR